MFCRAKDVPNTALITELSRFVLTNFEANGVLFHQLWGQATGTPLAVSAAVIYVAMLEERLLHTKGLVFYKRGLSMTFSLSGMELTLNNLAPTVKLTSILSHERRLSFGHGCGSREWPFHNSTLPEAFIYLTYTSLPPLHFLSPHSCKEELNFLGM